MSETECPRCGSLLPNLDEGLCHTCGYVFGHATVAMPALKKKAPADNAAGAAPQVAAAPPTAAAAAPASSSGNGKMIGLLVAIGVLLVIVIGAILAIVFTSGDAEVPPPAPVEAPAE